MSQNYSPFPAVCGQTPASVLIAGLGPKCIRCVLEENESGKYFNRRNTLLLVVKNRNVFVLHFKKRQVCWYGNVSGNSCKINNKTEKNKKVEQLKSISWKKSRGVLSCRDSRQDLCTWTVVAVQYFCKVYL